MCRERGPGPATGHARRQDHIPTVDALRKASPTHLGTAGIPSSNNALPRFEFRKLLHRNNSGRSMVSRGPAFGPLCAHTGPKVGPRWCTRTTTSGQGSPEQARKKASLAPRERRLGPLRPGKGCRWPEMGLSGLRMARVRFIGRPATPRSGLSSVAGWSRYVVRPAMPRFGPSLVSRRYEEKPARPGTGA